MLPVSGDVTTGAELAGTTQNRIRANRAVSAFC